jgi:hypothetical protein
MPGKLRLKHHNTILVRLLNPPMKRIIQIRRIIRISIPIRHNTRIHTGTITMPNFEESFRNWLARLDVDDLDVESQGNTLLIIGDVFAD